MHTEFSSTGKVQNGVHNNCSDNWVTLCRCLVKTFIYTITYQSVKKINLMSKQYKKY